LRIKLSYVVYHFSFIPNALIFKYKIWGFGVLGVDKLGVKPTDWKRGADGNPYMPQGAHLHARDWARFGQWVMDGAAGADPPSSRALFEPTTANPGYGLSWWLLRPGLIGPSPRSGIDGDAIGEAALGEDAVMAAGAGDQQLYLMRKRGLLIAGPNQIMKAMMPGGLKWRDDEFLRLLPHDFFMLEAGVVYSSSSEVLCVGDRSSCRFIDLSADLCGCYLADACWRQANQRCACGVPGRCRLQPRLGTLWRCRWTGGPTGRRAMCWRCWRCRFPERLCSAARPDFSGGA